MKINRLLLAFATIAICFTAQAQETSAEKVRAFADKYLSLSGYLQGGFRWDDNTEPATTFYLHRARLSLSGNAAQEKVDYRLQVDMAGSPKICDLYVRYKPLKGLNLQIGQFKVPFSYENENCGPTTVEFIEYSYITTYLVRNNGMYDGIASTGRDIGFQLYGGFIERDGYNIINYNLGVFNGSGINRKDDNSSKDLVARILVKPFKGFGVTASYMYAETNVDDDIYAKAPRWSVGALEMTTDEIISALGDVEIPHDSRSNLIAILRAADMVKFAKALPEAEENEQLFTYAYYFVENTKSVEVEHNEDKRDITFETKIEE